MRHFLTRGEHREQVQIWQHGPNSVSRFMSEQTIHSSKDSWSLRMMAALGAVIPGLKTVKCSDAQEGDGKYKMHALTYRYSTQIYSLDGTTKSGQ